MIDSTRDEAGSSPPQAVNRALQRGASAGDIVACRWRLERALGTGGMGRVFAATHVSGRRDALKVIHAQLAADPSARARFLREAEVGVRVQHPGAVRILDAGISPPSSPYVAMELLQGATLDALWKKAGHGLPPRAVLRAIDRVLDVLEACHRLGVVHRDLKPSNVFVTDAGGVRLLDFGLARLDGSPDDLARPGTALGTPGFMAPEQAAGAWEHVDARSDLFSVGAMIFTLVSGVRLHSGANERESFTLAASQRAPSLAEVFAGAPACLVALVDRSLLWNQSSRFAHATQMREAVRDVLAKMGGDADAALPVMPARRRALHASSLDGTESPEAAALEQAFSWLEDLLSPRADAASHDAAREQPIDAAARWLMEAVVQLHAPVEVSVLPFGFRAFDRNVWEPAPPLDAAARMLHEAGVRSLHFDASVDDRAIMALERVVLAACAASRDDLQSLASTAWRTRVPGFHVTLSRPLLALEAEHGTEAAAEAGSVALILAETSGAAAVIRKGELVTAPRSRSSELLLDDDRIALLRSALLDGRVGAHRALTKLIAELWEDESGDGDAGERPWTQAACLLLQDCDVLALHSLMMSAADASTSTARKVVERFAACPQGVAGTLARAELGCDRETTAVELLAVLEDAEAGKRLAALELASLLQIDAVARSVLRQAEGARFHSLPADERERSLELVLRTLPRQAEPLCVRLLQRPGLVSDEPREVSRRVAARMLGRFGQSREALKALRAACTPMWWNSRALRDEASAACRSIEQRLALAARTQLERGTP